MGFSVKSFDPAPTVTKLQNRVRGLRAALPDVLHRAGRLVAVSLATSAQPYGVGEDSRQRGEQAVAGDIRRVYATPGNVFESFTNKGVAADFWYAITRGGFALAQKIMQRGSARFASKEIKPFDGGQAHQNARNNRGRVSKTQDPVFVVQTTRNLSAYVQSEVDKVGEGKGGWAACAKILGGTRGLPQWVTRHAGKLSPGAVVEDQNPDRPSVTLINQVSYAQQILDPGEKREAVAIAFNRLTKAMVQEERRIAAANPLS